jgi:hypothetical protein
MAFPFQKQEAFFEGHIQAFHFFGGVPRRITTFPSFLTSGSVFVRQMDHFSIDKHRRARPLAVMAKAEGDYSNRSAP